MSLTLVATPIGNVQDISLRGLELLKNADAIILEERKESTAFLRSHGISGKEYFQLNEHSTKEDLEELVKLCSEKAVALITDCGTPGFADPGADLTRLCRQKNIPVKSVPGPSSLMTLLSLSSERIDQFVFRGFLSPETEVRNKQWLELKKEKRAFVIMDTPYRLAKVIDELVSNFPTRRILAGINMTQESEQILEGTPSQVKNKIAEKKAEFMILAYPEK
jgi:16S rRNA (cytidine1402-2'-O)-methyltransferase